MSIKIKGITRYLLLSLGVPIITFFLWYNISLVPELNKANSIIEYNTNNINKLKNDSNNLFNDSYSNEEFNQDLNTFKIIYNSYLNKKVDEQWIKESPDEIFQRVLPNFYNMVYLKKYNPDMSYEELVERKIVIPNNAIDIKNEKERVEKIVNNANYNEDNIKRNKSLLILGARAGIVFPDRYFYNDLVSVFNNKYGENSIIKSLITKSQDIYPLLKNRAESSKDMFKKEDLLYSDHNKKYNERTIEKNTVDLMIGKAFLNNDKEKLKIYFKQVHEFVDFMNDFNIPYYNLDIKNISRYDYLKKVMVIQVMYYKNKLSGKSFDDYVYKFMFYF